MTSPIELQIDYLYHTTVVYNCESVDYWMEQQAYETPLPEWGTYHKDLAAPKYFTITPHCDYSSPRLNMDEVYLRYKTTKPLILSTDPANYLSYDGYISREDDCVEVYLIHPDSVLDSNPTEIPFSQSPCTGDRCTEWLASRHKKS